MVRNSHFPKRLPVCADKRYGRGDVSVKWALQKATWGNRRAFLSVWVCLKWVSVPPHLWDDEYGVLGEIHCVGLGAEEKNVAFWIWILIHCSNAGQFWGCYLYWGVSTAWQFGFQWEGADWEGEHSAGERSPNSVLQGVLVQEAKELLGVGWRGV